MIIFNVVKPSKKCLSVSQLLDMRAVLAIYLFELVYDTEYMTVMDNCNQCNISLEGITVGTHHQSIFSSIYLFNHLNDWT